MKGKLKALEKRRLIKNMGTCCLVGLLNKNQTVDFISVHYDGDTSYTGIRLLECIDSAEEVKEILSLGNMRSLGWLTDEEDLPAPYEDEPMQTVSLDRYLNTIIDEGVEYLYNKLARKMPPFKVAYELRLLSLILDVCFCCFL